jgi:hypothetical protein
MSHHDSPHTRRGPCPYGHDDTTEHGYCRAEVDRMVRTIKTERNNRAGRGDVSGAKHSARHLARWYARLADWER